MMVRPVDFEFNAQTAVDNEFQNNKSGCVTGAALLEFSRSVEILQNEGIHVIVLEKDQSPSDMKTPDAVFPNNWFGTTRDGKIIVYTMATENRRAETQRLDKVKRLLTENGFGYDQEAFILHQEIHGRGTEAKLEYSPEDILEGTGAFIIDHLRGSLFAAKSVRCHPVALKKFAQLRSHQFSEIAMFETKSSNNKEFYHTNVMLSIGTKFAVVCSDAIVENPSHPDCLSRQQVLEKLRRDRTVIEISHEQAERYFCANILELRGHNDEPKIAMSTSAYNGFTEEQRAVLSQFGKLVAIPVADAIEFVGGGSARCMLAEVFLPKTA